MKGITAVIITLNEERNIGRCIKSLCDIADEIIVADSGSKDDTANIAQSLGARVVRIEWDGYAATKNRANELASYEYILSIDADEALSAMLRETIRQRKAEGFSGAYAFNRLTNYCGRWIRHCGWYPDRKLRLFPKGHARWEGEYVHERLVCDPALPTGFLQGDMLHFSYSSTAEHRERAEKYAVLGAEKLLRSRCRGLWWKSIVSPLLRFLRMYLIQLGFLDGRMGWHVCANASREVWMKYRKALKMQSDKKTV